MTKKWRDIKRKHKKTLYEGLTNGGRHKDIIDESSFHSWIGRYPDHISTMISSFESLWRSYPDQRFFQLISNIASFTSSPKDPYYVGDDVAQRIMDRMLDAIDEPEEFPPDCLYTLEEARKELSPYLMEALLKEGFIAFEHGEAQIQYWSKITDDTFHVIYHDPWKRQVTPRNF